MPLHMVTHHLQLMTSWREHSERLYTLFGMLVELWMYCTCTASVENALLLQQEHEMDHPNGRMHL